MKKNFLCIMIAVVLTATFMLGGCSFGKTADSASASNENNAISEEASEPTSEAEATPTAVPAESSATLATDWSVVVDNQITHPSNIAGFPNDKFGITVGPSGEIHYTDDGGKTWPRAKNNSLCRFSLDIVDENLIWCGGNGGNVRVSKDGGKTWSAVTDIVLGGMHSNIDFVDDTTGWIASALKLAATTDGGKTWTELTLPEKTKGIAAVCLRTPKDGYLLYNNGLFFTTKDGGATWSKQDLGFDQYEITDSKNQPGLYKSNMAPADISFTDENNGTIVFTGAMPGKGGKTWCLTTTDGGKTWTSELFAPIDGFLAARVFLSGDGKYLTLGANNNRIIVFKRN
jgi:photosystem II stability/assembly factor-like uncharacterized protein